MERRARVEAALDPARTHPHQRTAVLYARNGAEKETRLLALRGAQDRRDAGQRPELLRGSLRVAAGDDDP